MSWSRFAIFNVALGVLTVFLLTLLLVVLLEESRGGSRITGHNASRKSLVTSFGFRKMEDKCGKLCLSKECIYRSSAILSNKDLLQDRCANFYKYVCNNYPEDSRIIGGRYAVTACPQRLESKMFARLRSLLGKGEIGKKRKMIYDTCMRNGGGKSEVALLMNIARTILGEWPLPRDGNYDDSNVNKWLSEFSVLKHRPFFGLQIHYEDFDFLLTFTKNFDRLIGHGLEIESAMEITPTCEFFSDDSTDCNSGPLHEYLTDMLELAGIDSEILGPLLNDACRIDEKLRQICKSRGAKRNGDALLKCDGDSERWCPFLKLVLDKVGSKMNMSSTVKVLLQEPVLLHMDDFLRAETKQSLANYLAVSFIYSNMQIVDFYTKSLGNDSEADGQISDDSVLEDRRLRCLFFITKYLPFSFAGDYLKSINVEKKLKTVNTVYNVVQERSVRRTRASAFSDMFKSYFIGTVSKAIIDNPDYIQYIIKVLNFSTNLEHFHPHRTSFAMNVIEAKKYEQYDKIRDYNQGQLILMQKHRNDFNVGAAAGENLRFGFGFLEQIGDDDEDGQSLSNYATLGTILAHELGHVITELFYSFLKENRRDAVALKAFQNCLMDSYSRFQIPYSDMSVNGNYTFTENIADFFGVDVAYEAVKVLIGRRSLSKSLPGLNSTVEDAFFQLFADTWCQFGDTLGYRKFLGSMHSPSEHRVNGPLMYSDSLSKSLNCPLGSYMNPTEKCQLWPN